MESEDRPRPVIPFLFRFEREEEPGAAWRSLFERTRESYEAWFSKEGDDARPDLASSRAALERHMPELVPLWERLVELGGGDERTARLLGLYRPTPYLTGCSQAVWSRGEPALVRNYDYHPDAFEGVFLHAAWDGVRTLVASDCLWGALDGINEHGLVVSLAFGGRGEVGEGFGIPLILRYALQTCRTAAEAALVLERVPSHMSYNVSLLDAVGEHVVVAVAPDRATTIAREDVATNHQRGAETSRYAKFTRSVERERELHDLLGDPDQTLDGLVHRFLEPPLHSTNYARSFGTLYTAVYRPLTNAALYRWPDARVERSIDEFEPTELLVEL